MKAKGKVQRDEMRQEYDFDYSTAVRGKFYRRLLKEGANVVVLEPDVAKAFRSSAAVNEALRSLLKMSAATQRLTSRSSERRTGKVPSLDNNSAAQRGGRPNFGNATTRTPTTKTSALAATSRNATVARSQKRSPAW